VSAPRFVDAFKKRVHKTIPRAREGPKQPIIRFCAATLGRTT